MACLDLISVHLVLSMTFCSAWSSWLQYTVDCEGSRVLTCDMQSVQTLSGRGCKKHMSELPQGVPWKKTL